MLVYLNPKSKIWHPIIVSWSGRSETVCRYFHFNGSPLDIDNVTHWCNLPYDGVRPCKWCTGELETVLNSMFRQLGKSGEEVRWTKPKLRRMNGD